MFTDSDDMDVAMEGMLMDEAADMMRSEFESRAAQKQIDSELLELEVKMMLEML